MSETYDPNSLDAAISRIETAIQGISAHQSENSMKLDKALDRISDLERFKYWVLGGAGVVGAAAAKLMSFVGVTTKPPH